MKYTIAFATAFASLANCVSAFELQNDSYTIKAEYGKLVRYEAAGQIAAVLKDELHRQWCEDVTGPITTNQEFADIIDRVNAANGDEPFRLVALGGFHFVSSSSLLSKSTCRQMYINAANFGLLQLQPLSTDERNALFIVGAMDNTNCDFDKEDALLWRHLARAEYEFLSVARLQGFEVYEAGGIAGVDQVPAICAKISDFGKSLTKPVTRK